MRVRTAAATATVLLALAVTGCGTETTGDTASAGSSAGRDEAPEDSDDGGEGDGEAGRLPDLTGMDLQSAQDEAQKADFYDLISHDALGRDRVQAMDRNWKVCSQAPEAGRHPTDTRIDFGTVKREENCPDKDIETPDAAGSTMPDFTGKAVSVARDALAEGTEIAVTDISGEGRMILVESNWQVCRQEPAPGEDLDGRPITLDAVKFEESC
ncbi:hypothetical protein ACIQNG_28740 [Streptomyces sp. NPDC091377]|uniref:hypothetical protein n=1 Tax=unclassified Streptomyces TaxID=2593676 RepID=UPI0038222C40